MENFCLQCLSSKTASRTYLTGRVVDEEFKPTPKKSKASSSKYHAATTAAAAATATAAAQCEFCCGTASSPPSEMQHCIEKYTCNGNHEYNVCICCHAALQKQFAKWMRKAMKFNLKCSTTITKNGTVLLSPQFRSKSLFCSTMTLQMNGLLLTLLCCFFCIFEHKRKTTRRMKKHIFLLKDGASFV